MANRDLFWSWLIHVRNQTYMGFVQMAICDAFHQDFAKEYLDAIFSVMRVYIETKDFDAIHAEIQNHIDALNESHPAR